MSYAQTDFLVRYRRMRGDAIFYPIGFGDNGLPTERFVERKYDIDKHSTTRHEFRRLCLEETIAFQGEDGQPLVISTTRPELLPACVALFCRTDDARYAHLIGGTVRVPIAGHDVPLLADDEVDPSFGTGLMMVCTFGDAEDVRRWRDNSLDTRAWCGPTHSTGTQPG